MTRHFIYGYFGWRNTGDDAMLYAWLDRMNDSDEAFVLAREPSFIPEHKKVTWVRYNIFAVAKSIIKADRFVIAGGTHLSDYGTPSRILIILGRIFLLVLFARIFHKQVCFDSIGVVCRKWWSYLIIKSTCKMAHRITVRDSVSKYALGKMGLKTKLVDDLTKHLLRYVHQSAMPHRHILGVSVTPMNSIYHKDELTDLKQASLLAKDIDKWLFNSVYDEVRLIIFKDGTKDDDREYTRLLYSFLKMRAKTVIVPYNTNPISHMQTIAECERVISTRFHACYYAYIMGTPFVSISQHPKNRALLTDIKWKESDEEAKVRVKHIVNEYLD
jgi:polysaccharide pyruvyl transferase WcaK-like protein